MSDYSAEFSDDGAAARVVDDSECRRTLNYADAAIKYIKGYRIPAYPRHYELWYTYAAGYNTALNKAINALLRKRKTVGAGDVESFYAEFLSPLRHAERIGKVGRNVGQEIDTVLNMIDSVAGSASNYGESLNDATAGLSNADTAEQIKSIVERIILATEDVATQNAALEKQLSESRDQIVELQENLESIRFESMTDELTGLPNRRHFDEWLIRAIGTARSEGQPMSLVMCDIDNFKRFNDTFGHQTGDQVLKLVGSALKKNTKGQDLPARYGGEEFVIILPNTGIEAAVTVSEHIREAIQAKELIKRSTGENLGNVTMSFGVALLNDSDSPDSIVERADSCLYASKRNGRNRVTPEEAPSTEAA